MKIFNRKIYEDVKTVFKAWFVDRLNDNTANINDVNIILAYSAARLVNAGVVDNFEECCIRILKECDVLQAKGKDGSSVFFTDIDAFWEQFDKQLKEDQKLQELSGDHAKKGLTFPKKQ